MFPKALKDCAKRVYGLLPLRYRLDKRYFELKKLLIHAQWWDLTAIEAWQLQKTKEIVKYAYDNVAGYNQLYREANVSPEDIRRLEDLALLPLIDKETIRNNINDFVSRSVPVHRRIHVQTSGSTGVPFQFCTTTANQTKESAFMETSWEWAGWRMDDRAAVLRGKFVGSERKFWQLNPMRRELWLSSYFLSEATYQRYVEKLLRYKPRHLMAYPSAAANLADLVLSNGDAGRITFKTIFLGSENIYDWQKQRLRSAFHGARVFGWYGHAEQAIYAPMCEYSDEYHVWPLYGFAEVLSETGEEIKEGETGRLVGTSFWNHAIPFIRYETSDYVRKGRPGCSKCGRRFQLLESIDGRAREMLVTKTGRRIPAFSAANLEPALMLNIKQFQFAQETPGRAVLRIIKKPGFTDADTERIRRVLGKKLGDDIDLEILFTEKIAKTQAGKTPYFDNERTRVGSCSMTA